LLRVASDAHLVDLIRQGRAAAFEALYDRHHRAILSFCRHMLGSLEEAEDAVQHTFLAAYNDLVSSHKPIHLRAWLFTIARNRCYSILRARREQALGELDEPTTEGLATQVQRRQDLRDLVGDLRRLPDEQRAALVLSEMDSLSHEQIADVLGVPKEKVKALVFQARESLVASRAARETDCADIREQLANLRGGALRRANLRRHLHECAGCREFRQAVDHQRRQLRVLLPVAPTLALKETVLAATVGGGATVTAAGGGGGVFAGSLLKGGVVKGLLGAALAGVGTAGTIVAVHDFQVGSGPSFGGSHQLTSRAPFTPAAPTRTAARHGVSSTSSYTTTPASPSARAASFYAAPGGIGSVHSHTGTAAATMIAVLHPLSPKGLTSTLIPSPLLPPAPVSGAGSTVAAPPSTSHAVHVPKVSPAAPNSPYLAPSAFGAGGQDSSGGTRSTSSNRGASPSTSSSGPATGQSSSSSTASSGQTRSGSGRSGWGDHSVSRGSGNSGETSHVSAPTSSGSSSAGRSATGQSGSGESGWASGSANGSGGSRGGGAAGSSSSTSGSGSAGGSTGSGSTGSGTSGSRSAGGSSSGGGAGSGTSGSWSTGGSSGSGSSGSGSSGSGASGTGDGSGSTGSGYGGGSNTSPHGR
jgi:RNA polymerase sigma factor (sigma-70 family)